MEIYCSTDVNNVELLKKYVDHMLSYKKLINSYKKMLDIKN